MEFIAANAVDLVADQILHGRRGVPEHPKTIISAGEWIDNAPQPAAAD